MLHTGETVQIFRDEKWKPVTVAEKLNEPRNYNVKTENESMYRRNLKHSLKKESDEIKQLSYQMMRMKPKLWAQNLKMQQMMKKELQNTKKQNQK